MLSATIAIPRPAMSTVKRRPMIGLKAQAIIKGAHPECMAAGRAGACEGCLSIVDAIIDGKH